MISVELARRLLSAGLVWEPQPGDRFIVVDRGMNDEVFYISELTVDVYQFPSERVVAFNGTTEWAMDSVALTDALWLPNEGRLREELGARFGGLRRDGDEWVVVLLPDHREFRHRDAESAYALALLEVLDF